MNFLTSALNTFTGGSIPYTFGEERISSANLQKSIWKLFDGTKREDGSLCSIFSFDVRANSQSLPLAQNAARKLRGLKLPNVLKVLDTFENDSYIYIVTERVIPISELMDGMTAEVILYVIYGVSNALKFVNVEGSSVLGHIDLNTVFLNSNGEPRLGGFEICTNLKSDPDQSLYRYSARLPGFQELLSPEVSQGGVDVLKGPQTVKFDSWRLGVFIFKLFNKSNTPSSVDELGKGKNIPKSLVAAFKKLVSPSVTVRATVEAFLRNGESTYFNTELIHLSRDLEELHFKNDDEKLHFFQSLEPIKGDLPFGLLENRILPELLTFFKQYPSHSAVIIKLIMLLSESLSKETHIRLINPIIIKAFTMPDRSIRVLLLATLPKYIDLLTNSQVSDSIFNNFVTGFSDSSPAIREETIKATLYIAPKLSDRQLNNELLRFLAKTQADEQPEIRTNTTILIGKIAEHLNKSSRSTVLATAFGKALKDPFIHSRIAAILALSSCIDYFTPDVIANRILTVIAPSLLDKSSKVRSEAQKAFDLFFQKIKTEASKLPLDKEDDSGESEKAMKEVTENVANFGISFSGTFNKLTSGLAGSLNQDTQITPEHSRTNTPSVISSFNKYDNIGTSTVGSASVQDSSTKASVRAKSTDDFGTGDDFGWDDDFGDDDESVYFTSRDKPQTSFQAPKVTSLVTNDKRDAPIKVAPKKKGLQLGKPKASKLKLELDTGDADGWDDGW